MPKLQELNKLSELHGLPEPLRRHTHSFARAVRIVLDAVARERIPQVAGSLTFTTVLALVPLLVIVFAVFTAFPAFAQLRESLRLLMLENLVPPNFSDTIFRTLNSFAARARGLTLFGVLGLAVTSMIMVLTIDRAVNAIWRVRRPRPFGQRLLIYGLVVALGPLLFAGSLALTSYAVSSFGFAKRPPLVVRVAIDWIPVLLTLGGLAAMYRWMPNRRVAWRDALWGGAIAALGFELAKLAFALYVTRLSAYSMLYGSLAALPVFLLWVYLSWMITLIGAVIAASGPERRHRHWMRRRVPGAMLAEALLILRTLQDDGRHADGITLEEAASAARIRASEAERLLYRLENGGLIKRGGLIGGAALMRWASTDHWTLARPPADIRVAELFRALVYDGARLADLSVDALGDDAAAASTRFAAALRALDPPDPGTTLATLFR